MIVHKLKKSRIQYCAYGLTSVLKNNTKTWHLKGKKKLGENRLRLFSTYCL